MSSRRNLRSVPAGNSRQLSVYDRIPTMMIDMDTAPITPADAAPPLSVAATPSRLRERAWRLVAWLGAVGVALGTFLWSDLWTDYKNSALHVAIIVATLITSVWLLRNSGGSLRRRLSFAVIVWAPLWAISPFGIIKLVNNGNVGVATWRWRWDPSPDELLGGAPRESATPLVWTTTPDDYPAFLGGRFWAEVPGVELETDWKKHPPQQVWKQPIGAGWSGFAIVGKHAITQEQRGPNELVVCYDLATGKIQWSHQDDVRWDPGGSGGLGGVGPRATPTVAGGRVYSVGATGTLNCLEAPTGKLLWSHDTLREENAVQVMWGRACSPIVVGNWIVVSVGGSENNSLVAYDAASGKRVWGAGNRQSSYATPVLATLAGVEQIVVVNQDYVTSHDAATGAVLWEHAWAGNSDSNASNSQPVPVGDDRLLLSKGYSIPAQVVQVRRNGASWTTEVVWEKSVLRTKMSNVLVRDGYVYAIDDIDLVCVELATGKRKWKSRRRPVVGNGQIMLVGDSIVVLSESGEVILVEANPKKYRELGSFPAIEGVTWNTAALSRDTLLVRNAEEAACFKLPLREAATTTGDELAAASH
jgi:outer membrane protein assembly factor BamB